MVYMRHAKQATLLMLLILIGGCAPRYVDEKGVEDIAVFGSATCSQMIEIRDSMFDKIYAASDSDTDSRKESEWEWPQEAAILAALPQMASSNKAESQNVILTLVVQKTSFNELKQEYEERCQ